MKPWLKLPIHNIRIQRLVFIAILVAIAAAIPARSVHAQSAATATWRIAPRVLNFGKAPAGSTRTFAIINTSKTGGPALNVVIGALQRRGAGAFSVSPSGVLPPINVGSSTIIAVTFVPTDVGQRHGALIPITSNVGKVTVQLKGNGTSAIPTPTPTITPIPTPTPGITPTPTPGITPTPTPTPTPTHSLNVSGTVISGPPSTSTPVNGSTVTLYQAGTSPADPAVVLGSTVTDANGSFSIGTNNAPASTIILYLVASGGNAGGGVNPAINLMSVVGSVDSSVTSITTTVNELTTVSSAYVLSNYISNETNISDNSLQFLGNAIKAIGNLVNSSGELGSVISNGDNQPGELNSLANILASCVRNTQNACSTLFSDADLPSKPSDTLGAIININKSPANNAKTLFEQLAQNGPYSPTLAIGPTDWVLSLNYTGGGLNRPRGVAVDSSGNVWLANLGSNFNGNSVTKLDSTGKAISGNTGFTGGGLNGPWDVAVDSSNRVWITDFSGNSVTELDSTGKVISGNTGFTGGGLSGPAGIAIDHDNNVWVANLGSNFNGNSVTKLDSTGKAISGDTGFTGGGLSGPIDIAIDNSENAWVSNFGGNSVTELGSTGKAISGDTGFTSGGLSAPVGIEVDSAGNVWAANSDSNSVTKLTSAGMGTPFTGGGLSQPWGLAIDSLTDVWMTNNPNSPSPSISELDSGGNAVSPSVGYIQSAINGPRGVAIDSAGDVWVANALSNSVIELIGAAAPVKTPLIETPKGP